MNALSMVSAARTALAAAAVVLLAGCASDGTARLNRHEGVMRDNAEYIGTVEQIARRRGVRIVWMNPPEKRTKGLVTERE
jgi:hypothetical protein